VAYGGDFDSAGLSHVVFGIGWPVEDMEEKEMNGFVESTEEEAAA